MAIEWLTGDALDVMRSLPARSVDAVVGSPPFLNLRDYNGIAGQWGSERSPALFLDNLLALANEARRVLTPTGSLVFELGDTYSGSGGAGGDYAKGGLRDSQRRFNGSAAAARAHAQRKRTRYPVGGWPRAKSLTGVPTLFAWSLAYGRNLLCEPFTAAELLEWVDELRAAGMSAERALATAGGWVAANADDFRSSSRFEPWRIRNVIAWRRRNPAVGDLGDKVRPATSYITVACTGADRWFDLDAVRTPANPANARPSGLVRSGIPGRSDQVCNPVDPETGQRVISNPAGAPPLDHWWDEYDGDLAWLVNTQGSPIKHWAMWPAKLAERLVLSMVPREVCRSCGEPRRRVTEKDHDNLGRTTNGPKSAKHRNFDCRREVVSITSDWSDCGHDNYRAGIVLDPFSGTGTTLFAAEVHGRDGIGIDLDPANEAVRNQRRDEVRKALLGVKPETVGQMALEIGA